METNFSGQYYYGTGRRKSAVARVRLYKGKGDQVLVNGQKGTKYFNPAKLLDGVFEPLLLVGLKKDFDISVKVAGGGISGQADAMRHGISRALVAFDANLKSTLKKSGFLTRDSRVKERKKPGLKSARRAPQFSKR